MDSRYLGTGVVSAFFREIDLWPILQRHGS